MFIAKACMIVAILIAISYSLFVYRCIPGEIWGWYHSLISAVVSISIGISIAIGIFYYQTKVTDKEKKNQLRNLLSAEISDSIRILENGEPMVFSLPNSTEKVVVTFIQPLVLEDAFRSGLFNLVETENMIHLARKIRMYNLKVSHLYSVISNLTNINSENIIRQAVKNVEDSRKAIIESSVTLLKQMGLSLSSSTQFKN